MKCIAFFDVTKINTIENQNDETPSSPILSSKNRSRNTLKISSKLLLPPDSDETEDEITSPVFRHLVHLVTITLGPTVKACLFLISYGICDSYCKSNFISKGFGIIDLKVNIYKYASLC